MGIDELTFHDTAGLPTTPTAVQGGKIYAADGADNTTVIDPNAGYWSSTEDAIQEAIRGTDTSSTSQTSWDGADQSGGGRVVLAQQVFGFDESQVTFASSVNLIRGNAKKVLEVDGITDLRSVDGSIGNSVHVRTPTGQSGIFVPMNNDPFGRGDDGATALQASDGTWWVRRNALSKAKVGWFGTDEQAITEAISFAGSQGYTECHISEQRLPYNTETVTFDDSVRMVREGNQSDVYDLKAYGASGDGSSDDTAAINAALNGAQGSFLDVSFVYAPTGDFRVTEPIYTDFESVGWKGPGFLTQNDGDEVGTIIEFDSPFPNMHRLSVNVDGNNDGQDTDVTCVVFNDIGAGLDELTATVINGNVGCHLIGAIERTIVNVLGRECVIGVQTSAVSEGGDKTMDEIQINIQMGQCDRFFDGTSDGDGIPTGTVNFMVEAHRDESVNPILIRKGNWTLTGEARGLENTCFFSDPNLELFLDSFTVLGRDTGCIFREVKRLNGDLYLQGNDDVKLTVDTVLQGGNLRAEVEGQTDGNGVAIQLGGNGVCKNFNLTPGTKITNNSGSGVLLENTKNCVVYLTSTISFGDKAVVIGSNADSDHIIINGRYAGADLFRDNNPDNYPAVEILTPIKESERNAISDLFPGIIIKYETTNNSPYYYDGSQWVAQ